MGLTDGTDHTTTCSCNVNPSPAKGTLLCPIVALAQCGRHINVTSGMRARTTCITRFTFRKLQLSLRIYTLRNL